MIALDSYISIIVPIFNVEIYLEDCLFSITNQKYKNFEVILVDDGSTDKSGSICDSFKSRHPELRIQVIHKENGGLSDARNTGIESSNGNYLYFLDSDDYISPDTLSDLINEAKKSDADLVLSNYVSVNDSSGKLDYGSTLEERILSNSDYLKLVYSSDNIAYTVAWSKLYKKSLFAEIRFPKGKIHEDEYILYSIVRQCKIISVLNRYHYYYRQRPSSIMSAGFSEKRFSVIEAFCKRAHDSHLDSNIEFAEKSLQIAVKKLALFFPYCKDEPLKTLWKRYRSMVLNEYHNINKKQLKSILIVLLLRIAPTELNKMYIARR